jgi:hypothetical protein
MIRERATSSKKEPPNDPFGGLAVFQPLRIWLKDP